MHNVGEATPVGTIVSEERAFDHPFFPVLRRFVRTPEGVKRDEQLLWDRVGKNFAIAVVTDDKGNFVLVREPKYGQMKMMLSAPTGGVKKGEHMFEAVKRELKEETGYVSDSWSNTPVGPFIDFADKSDGGEHFVFFAENAYKVGEPRGLGQSVVLATRDELITEFIPSGVIPAMSVAALSLKLLAPTG